MGKIVVHGTLQRFSSFAGLINLYIWTKFDIIKTERGIVSFYIEKEKEHGYYRKEISAEDS